MSGLGLGRDRRTTPEASRRRFQLMLAATAVSSLGDGLAAVAFPLLAAAITTDARLIAGVAVAQHLPWLVFAPLTGALADRHDHRRFVAAVETGRMAALLVFGLTLLSGERHLATVYLAAATLGTLETAFAAVTHASLPLIVPADDLTRANGRLYATQAAGELFVGPALGGIAFAASVGLPFLVDGASFAASAVLLFVALPTVRRAITSAGRRPSINSEAAAGVRWVARHPLLRLLAVLIGCLAACQAMVAAVLVIYGTQALHLEAGGYGLFLAVGAIGTMLGGSLAGRIGDRYGTTGILVSTVVAASAGYAVMGMTSTVAVAAGATVVVALAVTVANTATIALRQSIVPPDLLGRAGNVFRMFVWGTWPLGAVAGGALTATGGVHAPLLAAAGLQLTALGAVGPRLFRRIDAARQELASR